MDDIAAFKLDSLTDITFTVTRTTAPRSADDGGQYPVGFLTFTARREEPKILSQLGQSGPVGDETFDTPRIRGGKVPFVFRTLPGFTFYAIRSDDFIVDRSNPEMISQKLPGWIRISYYVPGDDEERELGGFAGPES